MTDLFVYSLISGMLLFLGIFLMNINVKILDYIGISIIIVGYFYAIIGVLISPKKIYSYLKRYEQI